MLFFLWCFICVLQICCCLNPSVQTNVGLIRGLRASDGDYNMYLGIPYAHVNPKNPFGEHVIQTPFTEPFDAFDDSSICPQEEDETGLIIGDLDCLHLNVYVPHSANTSNPLPVMTWIHGGTFNTGSAGRSNFGPKYLVRHDVILVTLNYRVNVYGFMCLDIPEVPGNQGLKDQETALRWVKNNIAAFGGDDSSITVFGESAGAASADLQLRFGDPELFDKMIMQSGSASSNWAIQKADLDFAIKLADYLGFKTSKTRDALEFLSAVDSYNVTAAAVHIGLDLLWPCVEKEFEGVKRLIDDYTINKDIPRANNKSFLFGVNSEEWLLLYLNEDEEYFKTLNVFRENLAYGFDFSENEMNTMEKIVKNFYIGDNEISKEQRNNIANFDTDFSFIHPAERSIDEYINNGATNIYRYLFRYSGERNVVQKSMNIKVDGALHADELGYIFDMEMFGVPNDEDQLMIDLLTTMWTNFSKYGDPTPVVTNILPIKWAGVTPDRSYYLDIGSDLSLKTRPMHDRMAFWDLFFKYNHKRRVGYKGDL